MGAQLKLDKQTREQILALCRAGMHPDRAFTAVGISPSTLRKWRMSARAGKRAAVKFCDDLEQAVAQSEAADVVATRRAVTTDKEEVICQGCGDRIKVDPLAILNMSRHVSTVQSIKSQQAAVSMQRLKLRFPRRWSERVIHTVEDEHNRLLDVAQRLLAPEVFELLLETYLTETDGEEEAELDPGPQGSGVIH